MPATAAALQRGKTLPRQVINMLVNWLPAVRAPALRAQVVLYALPAKRVPALQDEWLPC
jgi:hypothetical protein